jgi:hypothetical protein
VRFPNHGGLTPAALVNERSCIAQVAVSPANVRTAEPPGAGGVSPPWHASILVRQETLGVAGAIPGPRRADGRRSCRTCVCAPRMSLFFSEPASCTRSGWRKPAVAHHPIVGGERNHSAKTDRRCKCGYRTTAGSRPPLLIRAFVVSPNISRSFVLQMCAPRNHQERGGRKPPVECEHPRSARNAKCCRRDSRTTALVNERSCIAQVAVLSANVRTAEPPGAGGVSPPWYCEHPRSARNAQLLPARFPNHGGLTPAALAERAFVHRECRYFSADRRRAPGAAGVIQPWRTIRSWVVNVITPRKPIAVASAVTEPRRADDGRS